MRDLLSGLARSILFFKATKKKHVWIPQYIKKDGTTVAGHMALVNVTDDHDNQKVAAGGGTWSQKTAHAALVKVPSFHNMLIEEQAAAILHHATEIQNKASAAAKLSVEKKKKQASATAKNEDPIVKMALSEKIKEANKLAKLNAELDTYLSAEKNSEVVKLTQDEKSDNALTINEEYNETLNQEIKTKKIKDLLSKIISAKLPTSNVNHQAVNKKLTAIHDAIAAGDIKTLLMQGYGSNTYAQKAVKLANEGLYALGSLHQVEVGQKLGAHPFISGTNKTETPAKPTPTKSTEATAGIKKQIESPPAPVVAPRVVSVKEIAPKKVFGKQEVIAFVNKNLGHNKIWAGFTKNNKLVTDYGKIGKKSQQNIKEFQTEQAAKDALEQLIKEKIKKGYVAIGKTLINNPIADESSPKDGDTKQGVDGPLIFKNGRWHKQNINQNTKIKSLTKDELPEVPFGANLENVNKINEKALIGDIEWIAYFASYAKAPKTKQYIEAVLAKLKEKNPLIDINPSINIKKNPKIVSAKTNNTPISSATVTPIQASENDVIYQSASASMPINGWKKTGEQLGHNSGGTFTDPSGQEWYCKFPSGGEIVARNELLASRLYALAGVSTVSQRLVEMNGKIGIASKILPGVKKDKAALLEGKAEGLLSGFAVDAWLANWDCVGNNPASGKGFDNILISPTGSAVRIDAGGALEYGGAGGKKQDFGDKVIELKTMLDPSKNPNTAAVFGKMSEADIASSVAKVQAISDNEIKEFCAQYGGGSLVDRAKIAETLIKRKADMLAQYPMAVKKSINKIAKEKPDPTKLKVDSSMLPPIHDFMNWSGQGKPISDKPYVKKNIEDEQALLDFALKGNLIALKDYKFEQVDKLTGEKTGKLLPIEQHPSNHVKAYHSDLVAALTSIAYPSEKTREFVGKIVDGIADIVKKFPNKPLGSTVTSVAANERLAFWMALGAVANVDDFRPKHTPLISDAAQKTAKSAYNKLSENSLVRKFINKVQASGSYNDYFRDGKTTDSAGNNLIEMNKAIHEYATEQPTGMTIHKWINMSDADVNALVATKEGTIFENAGSMCCSTDPAGTSGFGKHRMVIRYAPGAKAVDTFGSGNFGSEKEITTLPGSRFMILSSKMVNCPIKGKQRLELELLMLPPDPTYIASLTS